MKSIKSELFDALKELDVQFAALVRELARLIEVRRPDLSGDGVWAKRYRRAFAIKWILRLVVGAPALVFACLNVTIFVAWMEYIVTGTSTFLLLMVLSSTVGLMLATYLGIWAWVAWSIYQEKKVDKK